MESILTLEQWRTTGETLEVAAILSRGTEKIRAWFKVPAKWRDSVTTAADPFVIGLLFAMMQRGGDLIVDASVSPSLLANLDLYMAIFRAWFPGCYKELRIRATNETEQPPPTHPDEFLFPFSCGVDCCYSFARHHRKLIGRRSKQIGAAALVHGFDIPLTAQNSTTVYDKMRSDAAALLNPLAIPQICITNNLRQFPSDWIHAHISTLIASLHLFSKKFAGIVIANSVPFTQIGTRWGTSPVVDPLLSTKQFQIIDDGGEILRHEKAPLIHQWPDAFERLHVCANTPGQFANCCRCEKCVRTILGFRLLGLPVPPTFRDMPTPRQIRQICLNHELKRRFWAELYHAYVERGQTKTADAKAVRGTIRRGNLRLWMQPIKRPFVPLRNALRKIFRGSTKSKSQLQPKPADNL